jgi:hypothetical protein
MGNKKYRNRGIRHDCKRNKGYRKRTNRILMRSKAIKIRGTKNVKTVEQDLTIKGTKANIKEQIES